MTRHQSVLEKYWQRFNNYFYEEQVKANKGDVQAKLTVSLIIAGSVFMTIALGVLFMCIPFALLVWLWSLNKVAAVILATPVLLSCMVFFAVFISELLG